MSQHYFNTACAGEPVSVLMGWDRPLQGYFMVIEATCRDDYVYSNLNDVELASCGGLPGSLDYFIKKMGELGVGVPARMLHEIQADAGSNVGNRQVAYDADGNVLWER